MLMTTWKLILLRLFGMTLGHFGPFAGLLKLMLTSILVTSQKTEQRYVASSRFFDPRDLEMHH